MVVEVEERTHHSIRTEHAIKQVSSQYFDNDAQFYGSGREVANVHDVTDVNANLWKTDFLAGGAVHVPVHIYGVDIADTNLGFFNGQVEPAVGVVNVAQDRWAILTFQATGEVGAGDPAIKITSGAVLYLPDIQATEITIYSAENFFYFTESDQTDPAGRWRWRANGDIMYLEHATGASWATDEDWLTFTYGASITVGKAVILAEATNPAGTNAYIGRDNTGDVTINALTGRIVNLAIAGADVLRVEGDRVNFLQDIETDRWQFSDTNTFIGVDVCGADVLAVGAIDNTAVGYLALYENTVGYHNTAIGSNTLNRNTGNYNTAVGSQSLFDNRTGANNAAFGSFTLELNTIGYRNVAIGHAALIANTEGNGNIGLGYQAGDNITTGSYNTIVGYNVDAPVATNNYQIEIGDGVNQGRLRSDNAGDWTIYSPSGKVIKLQAEGDTDDYVTIGTNAENVPTIYGTGAYLRIGDAATTSHILVSENDLMVTGILEVDSIIYADASPTGLTVANTANISTVEGYGATSYLQSSSANNRQMILRALINDGAQTEIGRLQGGANPYFSMGGSQEWKFYNSGIATVSLGITGSVTALDITTTTSVTSGNCIALNITHTRDTDSVTGRDWGIKVTMVSDSDAKFPGGVNAVYGSLELGLGGAHGRAAGLQGELVMPNGQLGRGTFSCLHADLTCSANTNWGSAGPLSFISCVVGGTKTFFEANAYLFELTGVTEGGGNMCDNHATPAEADGAIRILINGAVRWLLYANDPD